ncbi:aminotransferase class I/II-fold pyridoxal phosphate-dependent enzyme [Synechococcus sp. MU1651]|uniref:aminotransferase class I/II-fold pyridoxal phosphate-dependent enzyme n=1 Tax=Synechococcus sp. MU1651 TaxID=2508353 RepID=UPI0020266CCD
MLPVHGGEVQQAAKRAGLRRQAFLDASASLVPWCPRWQRIGLSAWRDYPDRSQALLRQHLAVLHGVNSSFLLPGNGAAELFTWAARDAAEQGLSVLAAPGFADYKRALRCWSATSRQQQLPLLWDEGFPQPSPDPGEGSVLWICNPHNPTGQLWSRASLQPLLERYALVICDEAFLPLVPNGEQQSLIPLVAEHSNLVVIRSLTKLYGIAGLRLGYAVAQPQRLQRWAEWRDPWPVNGIALAVGERLLSSPRRYQSWCARVQRWTATEGAWMQRQLAALPGITPMPSAVNYLLIRANRSLVPLREALEQRHRILLRDCRSFEGLGETWLRIGLQSRRNNRRIVWAMREELKRSPLA